MAATPYFASNRDRDDKGEFDYLQSDELITRPVQERWRPFDETVEQVLREDSQRLMATGFLADLSIEIVDDPYANGVQGKRAVFRMAERLRSR